ncbi:MAG: hypothetical protein ACRC4S_03965, partial [Cetobacterium sp.]
NSKIIDSEINSHWSELQKDLKKECFPIFNLLNEDIENIFKNPKLRENFIKKLSLLEGELYKKLVILKNRYETSYSSIKDEFVKERIKFQNDFSDKNNKSEASFKMLKDRFLLIETSLEKLSKIKIKVEDIDLRIATEFKKFNQFVNEDNISNIESSYKILERDYKQIYSGKIIINRIGYLEKVKQNSLVKIDEIKIKKSKLKEIKNYKELETFILNNCTKYYDELQKFITADKEVQSNLKSEERVIRIYLKKYQKDLLELKKHSENFILTSMKIVERDYEKITISVIENYIENSFEKFRNIKNEGDILLKDKNLTKINIYLNQNYSNFDQIFKNNRDELIRILAQKDSIVLQTLFFNNTFKKIESDSIQRVYDKKNKNELLLSFREDYLKSFKIILDEDIEKTKKDIIYKIGTIQNENSKNRKELEKFKDISIKDNYTIELNQIDASIKNIKQQYLVINGIYDVKEDFYNRLNIKSEFSFYKIKQEIDRCIKEDTESHNKYYSYIKEKEINRELILKDYRKRFNISLEKGRDDIDIENDLRSYKKYGITLPNLENIELFIKDKKNIENNENKNLIQNLKLKLYLRINKVIEYKGMSYE